MITKSAPYRAILQHPAETNFTANVTSAACADNVNQPTVTARTEAARA